MPHGCPQPPAPLFGGVYYVWPRGVSAVLITSPGGHVLRTADCRERCPVSWRYPCARLSRRGLKLILDAHVHYDHAGGMPKRLSGAAVAASTAGALVLE